MFTRLKEKTGRSYGEWQNLIRAAKLAKHGEMVKFLKNNHGVTHGYANQIALEVVRPADAPELGSEDLVTAQYAGQKAALRPIYDKLVALLHKIGTDIELAPKKAYVSVRRAKQFAIIQPTTATRLDVGIKLKGAKSTARLEESGSFNAMVTHRVRVTSLNDVDAQFEAWLRRAYAGAG